MKIKVKPLYKPLVQMKWCCAACSVLWILHRKGYWVDQEEIAKELKIRVPKKDLKLFSAKMITTRKRTDYGAPNLIGKDAYLVDRFLRKHKIPLKMTPFKIGKVKNPKEFIIENIQRGNDIMLSFHWRGLGIKRMGHLVVLAEIDGRKDIITIGDPSSNRPKFWRVKLTKLIKAMSSKYDGCERGFYVFRVVSCKPQSG